MGGFSAIVDEEDEEAVRKRGYGDSLAPTPVNNQHRRSKSASDRNFNNSRVGLLRSTKKDQNETDASPPSTSVARAQNCLRDNPTYVSRNTSRHRASLEQDIEQLHLHLQQERSMRLMLERAMGRASSTLSPGHRHFAAQTQELIAEIELLEEEVANREQRVLTLYRSIFDNCVSRPPSEQNSGVASPAHIKHQSRKQPSIISSAFCSSKKFPLRPLQALVSINDLGKRNIRTGHNPLSCGRTDAAFAESCSTPAAKSCERVPVMEKTPMSRTLKDHLHQCPSKLSEEMVRCMAEVYCWLRSAQSVNNEKNRSPLLSRSSTNVIQPRRTIGEDQDWSGKSMVEILCISTDKSQFSHASYSINNYRVLVEQLERVNVSQMEPNAQTAFWINVYNALVMHAFLAYGIPNSSLRRLALFHKAAYNIGGRVISANAIEQSIFCFRTPRVGRWLETILSTALRKKSSEDKQILSAKLGLPNSQPLICFALCTGAFSDPVLRVYTASNVKDELEVAKSEFLQSSVVVKKTKKVFLPKMLERFAKEASLGLEDLLKWVAENVEKKLHDSIQRCMNCKPSKKQKATQVIEWLPYSSRFRYVFSNELMDKPWWS